MTILCAYVLGYRNTTSGFRIRSKTSASTVALVISFLVTCENLMAVVELIIRMPWLVQEKVPEENFIGRNGEGYCDRGLKPTANGEAVRERENGEGKVVRCVIELNMGKILFMTNSPSWSKSKKHQGRKRRFLETS
eukprot:TRINITY_DN65523_c0_g1_i1.p2 TRINITY_DN65523_c0_g1~~TRINITY_DN65523_c0_g1_i1.p2  ORF type:complete len:136 (+),score=17.53 TRINITY_DN65523_c0_g1_i1:160-567(+)